MSDILSQEEIDKILSSIDEKEVVDDILQNEDDLKVIKEYNFERPPKFNKEQLRTLEIIFDNYGRLLSSYLTGFLRINSQIDVNSSEQVVFKEFYGSIQNPIIIAIIDFAPLKGSIILELSASIGYAIIDRILGGPGVTIDKIRDFSDIEIILIKRVLLHMISYLKEPFAQVLNLDASLEQVETNSQFAQIVSPNEMVALTSLKIEIGEVSGFMNFCIPHMVIEPVIQRLNNKYWYSGNEKYHEENFKDTLGGRIEKTDLTVKAILGRTMIEVNDFIELKVGDVITLDSFVGSDIEIFVKDNLKFIGKPGKVKNKNSVQVTGFIGKEDI